MIYCGKAISTPSRQSASASSSPKRSATTSTSTRSIQIVDNTDVVLTFLQEAVNKLIEKRFDKFHEAVANGTTNGDSATPPPKNRANGVSEAPTSPLSSAKSSPAKRAADDSDVSDVLDEPKPKKKRVKKSTEDDDAAFAARLQQEENGRARSTRGGASRPVKKKTTKKKSSTKVKDNSDDSDVADEPKERKGGFHVSELVFSPHCTKLIAGIETYESLRATCAASRRDADLSPTNREKVVGIHQVKRSSGPQRQAPDSL